jgi:hypothetical protein
MHEDDVGGTGVLPVVGDVRDQVLDSVGDAVLGPKVSGFLLVVRRELDDDRTLCALLQKLDIDGTDAAADLEHGGAVNSAVAQELHHLARRVVEALAAVALRVTMRSALSEERFVTLRRAAAHAARSRASSTLWSASRTGGSSMRSKISW